MNGRIHWGWVQPGSKKAGLGPGMLRTTVLVMSRIHNTHITKKSNLLKFSMISQTLMSIKQAINFYPFTYIQWVTF